MQQVTSKQHKIKFENHFSVRVMEIIFPEGFTISSKDDLEFLKKEWRANLSSWHSPYTCVFDLRNIVILHEFNDDFLKLIAFFKNFFMKKIVGFKEPISVLPAHINFDVFDSYEEAIQSTGLARGQGLARNLNNLRERIVIENDFTAHVMDISFAAETHFETKEDLDILKDKIKNILRAWHSPYSIMFYCVNCTFSETAKNEFAFIERFLKGFFCKEIIGYSPKGEKGSYPFKTFRSRHIAADSLSHEGLSSGAVANCQTKKR